jgi:predicted Zn-dependent peptidase
MFKEQMRTTKNGTVIYDYKNPNVNGFYISLFLRAGSMHESHAGITHFLEHASIRNVNCMMEGGLYSLLDRRGIEFNASTFSEMVQFYISGATENFDLSAEIISRLLSPIILPPSEISTERDRIKAEIREADDGGSLTAFTQEKVFEGTSLSRPITGTLRSVSRIGKRALEEHRRRIFTPDNLFLYLTGGVADEGVRELCRMLDGVTVCGGQRCENIAPVPVGFLKRQGGVYIKSAQYTGIRLSFDLDMSEVGVAELDLLYDAVLSGYSSPLFMELSERRGLCYDLSGSTERYKNIGVLSFGFETREMRLDEALEVTLGILEQMKDEDYWRRAPVGASYVDNCMMLYDDNRDLNFTFAYDNHLLDLGYADLEERRAAYERAREPSRLAEVCRRVFRIEGLTVTVRGNKRRVNTEYLNELINKYL